MSSSELPIFWMPELGLTCRTTTIEWAEKSDSNHPPRPPRQPPPFFRDCQRIVRYYMGVIF